MPLPESPSCGIRPVRRATTEDSLESMTYESSTRPLHQVVGFECFTHRSRTGRCSQLAGLRTDAVGRSIDPQAYFAARVTDLRELLSLRHYLSMADTESKLNETSLRQRLKR